MRNFDDFCDVSLNKLLNKQRSCGWFDTPWRSCDVNVMCTRMQLWQCAHWVSFQCKDCLSRFHYKNKTVDGPSYIYNGNTYTNNTSSFYLEIQRGDWNTFPSYFLQTPVGIVFSQQWCCYIMSIAHASSVFIQDRSLIWGQSNLGVDYYDCSWMEIYGSCIGSLEQKVVPSFWRFFSLAEQKVPTLIIYGATVTTISSRSWHFHISISV